MADPNKVDPIHQFVITDIFSFGDGGFAFTNSSLFMVLTVGLIALFLLMSTRGRSIVPNRWQAGPEHVNMASATGQPKALRGAQCRLI